MKERIKRQIQKCEKGMAVAAGEVKSEDDRPAAPEERKKRHEEMGITSLLCFSSGTLNLIG